MGVVEAGAEEGARHGVSSRGSRPIKAKVKRLTKGGSSSDCNGRQTADDAITDDGDIQYESGGVLAPNGRIYFAPSKALRVLCIDSQDHRVEMLGPRLPGKRKYRARGILAPNGCILFAPYAAQKVLCVDTVAQTVEVIGPDLEGRYKYLTDGVRAPDGLIYFASNSADAPHVLCIDPVARIVKAVGAAELPSQHSQDDASLHAPLVGASDAGVELNCGEALEPSKVLTSKSLGSMSTV